MNSKQLAAQVAEGTALGNNMSRREMLDAQRFTGMESVGDTDLRETPDPDVPYDPITEIDFLTQEEVEQIGDLE